MGWAGHLDPLSCHVPSYLALPMYGWGRAPGLLAPGLCLALPEAEHPPLTWGKALSPTYPKDEGLRP